MAKTVKAHAGIAIGAFQFAVETIFSHVRLIVTSIATVIALWIGIFGIPLIAMVDFFHARYGIDVASAAKTYLSECIPARTCSWNDFIELIKSMHTDGNTLYMNDVMNALTKWAFVMAIILCIFHVWIQCGFIRMALAIYDRKRVGISVFFKIAPRTICNVAIAMLLVVFAFIIGLMPFLMFNIAYVFFLPLFVVLGIKLVFVPWCIVDRNESIVTAIKHSFYATKNHFLDIAVVASMNIILGLCAAYVTKFYLVGGWLMTVLIQIPFLYTSLSYMYRRIAKK